MSVSARTFRLSKKWTVIFVHSPRGSKVSVETDIIRKAQS